MIRSWAPVERLVVGVGLFRVLRGSVEPDRPYNLRVNSDRTARIAAVGMSLRF